MSEWDMLHPLKIAPTGFNRMQTFTSLFRMLLR